MNKPEDNKADTCDTSSMANLMRTAGSLMDAYELWAQMPRAERRRLHEDLSELEPIPALAGRSVNPSRVLLTGSSGCLGRLASCALRSRGHHVRGADLRPANHPLDEFLEIDLGDSDAVLFAAEGVDNIVHLGALPGFRLLTDAAIRANLLGVQNIYEAAKTLGVSRVVLASTTQLAVRAAEQGRVATTCEAEPLNHYALLKHWAEGVAQMYHVKDGIDSLVLRIGFVPRSPFQVVEALTKKYPMFYLSHCDFQRCIIRLVESMWNGCSRCYAVSNAPKGSTLADLGPTRRLLGYEPMNRFPEGLMFSQRVMRMLKDTFPNSYCSV